MSAAETMRATATAYVSAMRNGHRVPAQNLNQVLEILREAGDGLVLITTLRCAPDCQCGGALSYELEAVS